MEKYYEIDIFYSLDYMNYLPIIHDDRYLVIVNNPTKMIVNNTYGIDDDETETIKEPNIIIYRFEDDNKTSLFAALYESDIDTDIHTGDRQNYFNIVDSALNTEEDGKTYLYLIMLGKSNLEDGKTVKNKLIMKKYHLGDYSLEYNLRSYRFRDSITFVALDFYQNQVEFTIRAVLAPNRDLYVFLFIASACLIILVIMSLIVSYKFWECRRLKKEVDKRIARDQQPEDEQSANDLMSGLESHFQDQDSNDN
jgi:hypothetical protein